MLNKAGEDIHLLKHVLQIQVCCYFKVLINFVLLRSFAKLIYDITFKYNSIVNVRQLQKWKKLQVKAKKGKLDLSFLKNCQVYSAYQKFLAIDIPQSNKTANEAMQKRLLKSAMSRRRKEHLKLKILTSIGFFILNKAIYKNCQDADAS